MRPHRLARPAAIVTTLTAIAGLVTGVGLAPAAAASGSPRTVTSPASLVNPLIGTGTDTSANGAAGGIAGGGDTFPGPDMPFGMIQWSPDTSPQRQNAGGYWYDSSQTTGFSLDHLSGAGCPVYGDVPILPMVGAVPADPTAATADFSHGSETAKAGYYAVTTTSPDSASNPVTTALTTTTRAGIARFGFPASTQSNLLLKVADSDVKVVNGQVQYQKVDGTTARVISSDEVSGSVTAGHFCDIGDSGQRDYTLHFDIRFSQPFTASSTWAGGPGGDPGGVALTFDTTRNRTVVAKVGISYTSDANAAANLNAEIPGWDFDAVHAANVRAWNAILGRIEISGGSAEQRTVFYTALYHALLDPHVFSDVNGQYEGMDGKVHTVPPGHEQYADFSGWDIYRNQVQLASLVAPHQASDIVQSMLNDYDQDGMLPKWSNANGESYEMVGDSADPIIAGAYAFGARDFDTGNALRAMIDEATKPSKIRPGQSTLDQYGYLPYDLTYGCCNFNASVSTQLEYDSDDYAIAAFAKALHRQDVYDTFAARAQSWQNTFDPATGYVRAKLASGQWVPGFTPSTSTGMVEGSAAEYTTMVPFNVRALIAARGGDEAWRDYLDSLTSNLVDPGPDNAQLSNEPSLDIPWEYNNAGAPWKTQQVVRQAQAELFLDAPAGLPGNDDLGTMSAWYVWSSLGLYPETPGTSTLSIGSPAFPHAVIHLASGRDITIDAPNAAPRAPYVHGLRLNGDDWPKTYLAGDQYQDGAALAFDLGASPDTSWGTGPGAAPPSDSTGEAPAIPYLPSSQVAVQAGQSAAVTLAARNVTGRPINATATAVPPAGITVTPSPVPLPPSPGSDTQQATLTVAVAAGTPAGTYDLPITVGAAGYTGHATVTLAVSVP
ncbi:MAG: GH92 family glycosyl hydrolase [Nocardiopsaceae bacterium]|nr:GH92 family glycosyl hydrolase [Nocardiopsaceae bacterium]